MEAISLTPSISADSVDLLLDSFNSKVKNVIDDIAFVKVCKKNGRQKSPWRKSTAVQCMKKQCRKAERMWRKTKLEIHYSIYKDSLHAFNVELATARQTFFSNLINSNLNNTRTLFATVEKLNNPPQSKMSGWREVTAICCGNFSWWSRSALNSQLLPGDSSNHSFVLLLSTSPPCLTNWIRPWDVAGLALLASSLQASMTSASFRRTWSSRHL